MGNLTRDQSMVRMYMNHSLSGIDDGLSELEGNLKNWVAHPAQRGAWKRVAEHLTGLRWLLEQHFGKLSGEGLLENVTYTHPDRYPELRSIEIGQNRIVDHLDSLILSVETLELATDELDWIAIEFRDLKQEIAGVESMELAFLDRQEDRP